MDLRGEIVVGALSFASAGGLVWAIDFNKHVINKEEYDKRKTKD